MAPRVDNKKSRLLLLAEGRIYRMFSSCRKSVAGKDFTGRRENLNPDSPFAPKGSDKSIWAGLLTCIRHLSPSRRKFSVT